MIAPSTRCLCVPCLSDRSLHVPEPAVPLPANGEDVVLFLPAQRSSPAFVEAHANAASQPHAVPEYVMFARYHDVAGIEVFHAAEGIEPAQRRNRVCAQLLVLEQEPSILGQ